ncbi:ammonium transporter [Acidithrix ferrooxidans]|uniref:Ammonium transporter n=1 Tax=Acidithrix ferrooxidans TaxID=1280514 RepID=A0A0D8HJ04_9ACTN|nr:ammonium transporter [Acidithrix ferrooxidans]KJF17839.1 ammonium transporter NrgA [Acidithrix ferrooxidans]
MNFNSGDTAWVLIAGALVIFMTPGLAFFYGGMVRSKNVLAMLMQNFVVMGIVSVLWVFVTYSLAFGVDLGGFGVIGTLHFFGLGHITQAVPGYSGPLTQHIPPLVFVIFQMSFAIITPAIITGSSADRLAFGPFVVFIILWSILVYAPVAHWVFSPNGWLFKLKVEDFAGGNVVEINSGAAGVALAIVIGKRRGWPHKPMAPHSVPLALLGGGILWFGWFGFNAGSALAANTLAAHAFINTNTAGACGMLSWLVFERLRGGKSTTLGAVSGAVAGLVAITPSCGFVDIFGASAIGLIAGLVCAYAITLKFKAGVDDALDVGGVHLVGGIVGTLLIGVVGTSAVSGINGILYGGSALLLLHQLIAVLACGLYSFSMTWLIAKTIDKTMGLRISQEQENEGMDTSLHAESAYEFGSSILEAFK